MKFASTLVSATEIEIGDHRTFELFGLTFNADTLWTTAIAGLIVIGLGFWMRSKVTSDVPSKIQVIWEMAVETVTEQVESNLGKVNPFVIPLAIALFFFILIANWLEFIPSQHWLPSPTADVNLTYALAIIVVVGVHVYGIRENGFKGAYAHLFKPYKALFPILLIEEIVKPFTLALRLFGNIFSSGIMLAIIGLLPAYVLWGPNALWKTFGVFIGLIQAFIFALLTILYFGMASDHDESVSSTEEDSDGSEGEEERAPSAMAEQKTGVPSGAQ